MPGGRSYSSATSQTTLTADPGSGGTSLAVVDSTKFSALDARFPYGATINLGRTDQEVVTVTARPDGTHLTVVRGQDGTTAVAHAIGATVDHAASGRDFAQTTQQPDSWQGLGHSYFQIAGGTFYQSGRADAIFLRALDVELTNWRNRAVNGAMLIAEGRAQGGWTRAMQEGGRPQRTAPYVSDGGATAICWGINDIGKVGGSTQAQIRVMYEHALRAVISRCRSAVYYDNAFSVGTRTTYGTGFASLAAQTEFSSSASTLRQATTTTSATITLTLPADYAGETVVTQFIAAPSTAGGTVTYSGTAGVTGTLTTLSVVPSGGGTHVPVVRRITGLTSANAGQSIIMTATSVTTSMLFDGWWLESKYPPPVLVCNCARVLAAGYAIYANVIGDTDVASLNTSISNIVAEFDQMVRLADIDTALGKDPLNFSTDGLHPNEVGAAMIADTLKNALSVLVPVIESFPTLNMNPSSPRASAQRKPRLSTFYYSVEASESWITANPPAQQMWAAPFVVTEGRESYNGLATRLAAGGSSAGTIRWGVYDDVDWIGYPQNLITEPTSGAALSLGTAAGIVTGSLTWVPDPGLYWICYKQITQGTNQAIACVEGPDRWGIMPQLDPTTLAQLNTPIAWVLGGQGAGALPSRYPPGASVDFVFPLMALKRV